MKTCCGSSYKARYRDSDGVIESQSNGLDLDYEKKRKVAARLIYTPGSNMEFDLRGEYVRERNGSTYQDKLSSPAPDRRFQCQHRARRPLWVRTIASSAMFFASHVRPGATPR